VYKSVYISSHVLTCIQTYICICLDMYGNLYVYVLTCMETIYVYVLTCIETHTCRVSLLTCIVTDTHTQRPT